MYPALVIVGWVVAAVQASNYSDISDAIPQLRNLSTTASSRYLPRYGGRNSTHCCLVAVNESFSVSSGNLSLNRVNFLDPASNLIDFEEALQRGQFPCIATYNGDQRGAPAITVPYDWCHDNCNGWEIAVASNLRQWIGPLVGFILPSLVFCLSIPRRRRFYIPEKLFAASPGRTLALIMTPLRAVGAAIIVSFDTLVWLCICFAAAGPMILSGVYEAFLDSKILETLRKTIAPRDTGATLRVQGTMTADMRAKLLLVILAGAFDIKDRDATTRNGDREVKGDNGDTIPVYVTNHCNTEVAHTRPSLEMENSHPNTNHTPSTTPIQNNGYASGSGTQSAWPSRSAMSGGLTEDGYPGTSRTSDSEVSHINSTAVGPPVPLTPEHPIGQRLKLYTESLTTWRDIESITQYLSFDPWDEFNKRKDIASQNAEQQIEKVLLEFKKETNRVGSGSCSQEVRQPAILRFGQMEAAKLQEIRDKRDDTFTELEATYTQNQERRKESLGVVQTRLRTMLATQYSFGSAIGAPVVFFAGAFVYTIIDTLSRLGDEDTSIGLAFGMWWMTIPHVSIVSGLLLGSNNPNTLEGIIGKKEEPSPPYWGAFALAYPSNYKTEWMWFRGRSKRHWLDVVIATNDYNRNDLDKLKNNTRFGIGIWLTILGFAFSLISVPFVLAFLTALFTPRVGVSCRSLTFLVYALLQVCQMLLWLWVFACSEMDNEGGRHQPRRQDTLACCTWWLLTVVFGLGSVFTAIGGTTMQLMGVYRNCLCSIPIHLWHNPHRPSAYLTLSTNTAEEIKNASTYWKGTGSAAIAFLCLTCYGGWWYQRRLRYNFRFIADNLEGYNRTDTTASEKSARKKREKAAKKCKANGKGKERAEEAPLA